VATHNKAKTLHEFLMPLHANGIVMLVSTYGCFLIYNRIDKTSRIWLYPFLQLARSAAFTVVVPIELVGAMALAAHMLSRWMPYQIYRLTQTQWPKADPALMRLNFVRAFDSYDCLRRWFFRLGNMGHVGATIVESVQSMARYPCCLQVCTASRAVLRAAY
jgi:hypothetical protein